MAGIITGVLFDFYRLIRGFTGLNKLVVFVEDTLFWIFTAIIVFVFLMYTNYAYLRMYVYILLAVGIYLYLKFFSFLIIRFHRKSFEVLGRVFRVILNLIIYFFQYIFYIVKKKNKKNYKN
ncbi:MAG: spore cortex biosynthesis protein YabQ [Clostridium luticellarii]|uniref:Spore cortex protein YabQ n=3 Tax=Clostridium luticellarii TaxID=1691940 RepID=A0A2T0BD54_9CLOT|nr:spore cortex biosynthesis protein YabQ [Clostridium luticellarii]MCI1968089.1 spore cortex biosynthesis protein YabQ [Clostridium luticellarii]MCI1994798.1 spore cortex biosynthesis protein YabQ [Clostridium luticellarii]MCI2039030.1 spore cortex biosynthesis protein YabQ [Clostridium luticellarii]PRR81826.1 Spore cortex protein YabQ [Clostridium luticellarii]